ncbi:MAG: hypothetical protein ACKO2G_04315 [Verrucomicrobiales bacterium]
MILRLFPTVALAVVLSASPCPAAGEKEIPINELPRRAAEAATSGKMKEAVGLYAQWVDCDPLNPLARASYGAALFQTNDAAKARQQLERAVLIEPKLASSWATLGLIYDRDAEPWLAMSAYTRAVHLEPRVASHRILLALSLEKQGWRDAAESALNDALGIDPESADAHFNLAALALRRTPPAKETARRHYQQARKLGAEPDEDIEILLGLKEEKKTDEPKTKPEGDKKPSTR